MVTTIKAVVEKLGHETDATFKSLQKVISYINSEDDITKKNDIILRLLEKRSVLIGYESIINSILHTSGLYQYILPSDISTKENVCRLMHSPSKLEGITFHREQSAVFQNLLMGNSVAISAPTSFGKSKIIDAIIAHKNFKNIAIVVPTIALLDETRRRLSQQFSTRYKIITQTSQAPDINNIFILTAERIVIFDKLPKIDFFVIDEFYKLSQNNSKDKDKRFSTLNHAFYKLIKSGAQAYLLGPNIQGLDIGKMKRILFYKTDFSTVATDIIRKHPRNENDKEQQLLEICKKHVAKDDQILIFCKSPNSATNLAKKLCEQDFLTIKRQGEVIASWFSENYHNDWTASLAAKKLISLHHGKLPRSIAQLSVKLFNSNITKILICTSSLIEGVNTSAKVVVIYDHNIKRKPIDYFTFSNIKGRSGRMFKHYVGKAYIFQDQPQEKLPIIDIPALSQNIETPNSLLIQIDEADLEQSSIEKLSHIKSQNYISLDTIKKNAGVPPELQIEIAKAIKERKDHYNTNMNWNRFPNSRQLNFICNVIWDFFASHEGGNVYGISSGNQLSFKLIQKYEHRDKIKELIKLEMNNENPKYKARNIDDAIDRVFTFEKHWCEHLFPQWLTTISNIQKEIFLKNRMPCGDYTHYASVVEAKFLPPIFSALDEYGLPTSITRKLNIFSDTDNIDTATSKLKRVGKTSNLPVVLSKFEAYILSHVFKGL
ncbi:DEAD/DEAH box helicase [Nitratidesulfovibrio sp. D1]|uniref:DEAD/DEAH box helicase n=1 Tax=Nitratidesulfovibrio sp. D1 TaxID=3440151 RepID=UPI003EC0FB56